MTDVAVKKLRAQYVMVDPEYGSFETYFAGVQLPEVEFRDHPAVIARRAEEVVQEFLLRFPPSTYRLGDHSAEISIEHDALIVHANFQAI